VVAEHRQLDQALPQINSQAETVETVRLHQSLEHQLLTQVAAVAAIEVVLPRAEQAAQVAAEMADQIMLRREQLAQQIQAVAVVVVQ
jgi:hypothetical protein